MKDPFMDAVWLYVNTKMTIQDIAEKLYMDERCLRQQILNLKDLPLSRSELECGEPSEGFLQYLEGLGYDHV